MLLPENGMERIQIKFLKKIKTKHLTHAIKSIIIASSSIYEATNIRAGIAQLVERNLAKVEVASSRLVSRSSFILQHSNVVLAR